MKTKVLYIIICFFCTETISAQRNTGLSIPPRIGFNISSFTKGVTYSLDNGETFVYNPKHTIGFNFGGEIEKKNENIGLSLGLIFTLEHIEFEDISVSSEDYRIDSRNFSILNKSLDLPLIVSYNIWGNNVSKINLESGLLISFLLNNTTKSNLSFYKKENDQWIVNNHYSGNNKGDFTDGYNKVQLAIPIGISYQYKRFSIDFKYNIGLTNVYKYTNENIYNRSFVLSAGYSITL